MAAPSQLTPAGGARAGGPPRSFFRDEQGVLRRDLGPAELKEAIACRTGQLWVEVDADSPAQVAVLEHVFGFHPLSIEDVLNPQSRVKIDEYPGYMFLIIRGVRFDETTSDPYDLETYNLCVFIGSNYVVTAHVGHSAAVIEAARRLERGADLLGRGVERLAHAVIDTTVDAYFPILDRLDDFVDGLEERVFGSFDRDAMQEIFAVKRLVLGLRRHLVPQRDIFNVLTNRPTPLLTPEVQLYFRDIYDHQLRIVDALDTYRDLLSSTMDSYLTQVSNRLGKITLGLSVVATMSIPFVVVSGMWGMNFQRIPLASHPLGFWIMLVAQLAIGVALVAALRWRRLL